MGNLRILSEGITICRRDVDEDMPLRRLSIFLYIADNEGCSLTDIEKALNLPYGTVSANCKLLGMKLERTKKGTDKVRGHDLVEAQVDPYETRRKNFILTPKGKALIKQLKELT